MFLFLKVRVNVAGDEKEDETTTGGPFSALCQSMRPGEEEREAGENEVFLKFNLI